MIDKMLVKLRKQKGVTQSQMAKDTGLSRGQIANYEVGSRQPDFETLKKLSDYFGVSADYLLGRDTYSVVISAGIEVPSPNAGGPVYILGENSKGGVSESILLDADSIILVPVYGSVAAGMPIEANEEINDMMPMDTRLFSTNGYDKSDFFYLRVKGHSMAPTISDGDIVLVRKQPVLENGEIGVLICNSDNEATIKRFRTVDNKVVLIPDNRDYDTQIYESGQCKIVGKVLSRTSVF